MILQYRSSFTMDIACYLQNFSSNTWGQTFSRNLHIKNMCNRIFCLDLWPTAQNLLLGGLVVTPCFKYLSVFDIYCCMFWACTCHLQILICLQKFVSSLSSSLNPSPLSFSDMMNLMDWGRSGSDTIAGWNRAPLFQKQYVACGWVDLIET